jgi:hypothetical protein
MLPIFYKCSCGYKVSGTSIEEIIPYINHFNEDGEPCHIKLD